MKMILLTAALLLSASLRAAGFELKAHLTGDKYEGKMVHLYTGNDLMTWHRIDSARIQNGHVAFRGRLKGAQLLTLRVFPDETRGMMGKDRAIMRPFLPILMGNEKVSVTAAVDSLGMDFDTLSSYLYDYSDVDIQGSPLARKYADFTMKANRLKETYQRAMRPHYAFLGRRATSPLREGVETLDAAEPSKQAYEDCIRRFVNDNTNNAAGLQIFSQFFDRFTIDDINRLEAAFPTSLRRSALGIKAFNVIDSAKVSAVGAPFYDCELQTPEGKTFRISDYAGKGRYVLLEFWASWCGPCRADIPHLKEAYEAYHPHGFEIISISMDNNRKAWTGAVEREQMNWIQGSTLKAFTDDLSKAYNFNGIPFCILVGPDGKIVERNWRGSSMDRGLIKLYGNHFGSRYDKGNTAFRINGFITDPDNPDGHADYTGADGMKAYLITGDSRKGTQKTDSTEIKLGQFVFKGDMGVGCAPAYLRIGPTKGMNENVTTLYVEPGTLGVAYVKSNLDRPSRTYGSVTQSEIEQFEKDVDMDRLKELNKQYYEAANRDSISKLMEPIRERYQQKTDEFISSHPASYLTPGFLMGKMGSMVYTALVEAYNKLDPKVKIMPEAKEIEQEIDVQGKLQPGQPAPLFTKNDVMTGKPVSLQNFRGKYVLIDFWATWCVPCRQSNPHMRQLYDRYHKKGLEFIYVADDDRNEAKLKAAIAKDGLKKMHHVLRGLRIVNPATYEVDHTNDISDRYGIHFLPTKYLIDPDGKIIGKFESDELDRKLQEIFK